MGTKAKVICVADSPSIPKYGIALSSFILLKRCTPQTWTGFCACIVTKGK